MIAWLAKNRCLGTSRWDIANFAKGLKTSANKHNIFIWRPFRFRKCIRFIQFSFNLQNRNQCLVYKFDKTILCRITSFILSFSSFTLNKSLVIPIHKNNSTIDLNNYQPILLLSPLSKVLGKNIKRSLRESLDNHSSLSENWYGFRNEIITGNALVKCS